MRWDRPGAENTEGTVALAVEQARARGIDHLIVATNTGATVRAMLRHDCAGLDLIAVTHHVGFRGPGEHEMTPEVRRELSEAGVTLYTATHMLAGVDRGVRNKFGGLYPPEIMAETLRMLGQGVKVAVEMGVAVLDAGLVPYGVDVIAVAGTRRGADTACVIRPAHSNAIFDFRVGDILCRPLPVVPEPRTG